MKSAEKWAAETGVPVDTIRAIQADAADLAWHVARQAPLVERDWACRQCVPESDLLVDGFVCDYHQAIALRGAVTR